jgi:hypothetical protein
MAAEAGAGAGAGHDAIKPLADGMIEQQWSVALDGDFFLFCMEAMRTHN